MWIWKENNNFFWDGDSKMDNINQELMVCDVLIRGGLSTDRLSKVQEVH